MRHLDLTRRVIMAAAAACLSLAAGGCATATDSAITSTAPPSQRAVTITTADGVADALLFTPGGKGAWPAIVIWPDMAGLRPTFGELGRRLAAEGYVVLVPNSFYRSARLDGSSGTGDLSPEEMKTRMAEWRAAASDEGIARDSAAYVAFLDALPQVDRRSKIGTAGYNVGAAHAFRSAAAAPDRIGAVAIFHPLGVATPRPNSPHLLVGGTRAAYLVALAQSDDAREPEDKDDLRKAFADAGLQGTVEVLPANHGFAVPDNKAYDSTAAEKGWAEMLALFRRTLG